MIKGDRVRIISRDEVGYVYSTYINEYNKKTIAIIKRDDETFVKTLESDLELIEEPVAEPEPIDKITLTRDDFRNQAINYIVDLATEEPTLGVVLTTFTVGLMKRLFNDD